MTDGTNAIKAAICATALQPSPYIQSMEDALAAVVAGQPDAVDKARAALALAKAGAK